jgi:hypothetical protein
MDHSVPPADLAPDAVQRLLEQGRARSVAASERAALLAGLQRHFTAAVEPPDPAFDRALTVNVRDGEDTWAVSVSLAAPYAYVVREDTSQLELITPTSEDLFPPERTLVGLLAEHGFRVLALAELQHAVESGDEAVRNVFELCFQEGGQAFWEFSWFAGQA